MNKNHRKDKQLGMPIGTASNRLRKILLFSLVKKLGNNICYRCHKEIKDESELSIEHKIPYLDSVDPIKLFFDLNNIAFSHFKCNVGCARRQVAPHGGQRRYKKGCRCELCTKANNREVYKYRNKKKTNTVLAQLAEHSSHEGERTGS